MHRTTIAGLLLSCGAASFWACASDKSPPTAQALFPPATPGVRMDVAAPSCEPKTHPSGLLVDKVMTPPAFGMAVRDDGLAYFTEFQNGGVGIQHADPNGRWLHCHRKRAHGRGFLARRQ